MLHCIPGRVNCLQIMILASIILSQNSELLLGDNSLILKMALGSAPPSVAVQRAALNFITTLCSCVEVPRSILLSLMDALLSCLINPPATADMDTLFKAKVCVTLCLATSLSQSSECVQLQ